ncbi:helicase [Horticoccus luteus]|uniref:Helicase n=1 Tax=Horticoccus luteus TaxID=2862869 RepID=A0A8F9XIF7_9BACT|nr:helicase C-terminal domain-containing protein [Horticoccus luteus]QYM77543.1 helicase [Horticoccus luteus]
MEFSLDQRSASLSVGEFAAFNVGPRESGDGPHGVWRAQLGVHWHNELRARAADDTPAAEFEVAIAGAVAHRGWVIQLTGRIDQWLPAAAVPTLREIKTVLHPLPVAEAELRADHPDYFAQLAAYVALRRLAAPTAALRAELVFVEAGSGLAQTVVLTAADETCFDVQLERVVEFLDLRARARERLRHLHFRSPFATLRPGQETTRAELTAAFERHPAVLFEAPTGFGKTGVLLEFALGQLQAGHFERVLYLTSKATGQLQVVRTLAAMTAPAANSEPPLSLQPSPCSTALAVWHVRNKAEHCVNHTFHCVRDSCTYLADVAARWAGSGLSRFYLFEDQPRDLPTLRDAGRQAGICPYEITRTALAFNDVWIGDYNYVFAPRNRGLFFEQPGFDPARTLLLIDEAHNLPARVADAYSHTAHVDDARPLLAELDHQRASAPLLRAWENWVQLLGALPACDSLDPALEADVTDALDQIVRALESTPLDYAALGPTFSDQLWRTQDLAEWLADSSFDKLLWCARAGELRFTCLNAAAAIGRALREFGGVVCATATFGPAAAFADACGFAATPTPHLALAPTTTPAFFHLSAHTPWRDTAYDVGIDARVDTTYQRRSSFAGVTGETIVRLHAAAGAAVAVFFPSYAYAEQIVRALERAGSPLRIALQPRLPDLAAQTAWVEESLAFTDAVFLVLGSSFAESIDLLGGRVTHAMVVGPALPEVNAVQRARVAALSSLGRGAAFRRVYQIPGMQKVNQALGRLVRAPGQRARVLLHCRRFAEPDYASLLAPEYQLGTNILDDADLTAWLAQPFPPPAPPLNASASA